MNKPLQNRPEARHILSGRRILLPVLLGASVTAYLFYRNFNVSALSEIRWTIGLAGVLLLAILTCILRDLMYIWRLRLMTDGQLSWGKCFQIIMLWEFGSAVTPGAVGGSVAAVYMLNKEGFTLGKASAISLVTAFLDELVFILAVPVLYLLLGNSMLSFDPHCEESHRIAATGLLQHTQLLVLIVYLFLLSVYLLLFYGLFINPYAVKNLYSMIGQLPFINRWKASLDKAGDDMVIASAEFKSRPFLFWILTGTATMTTWTARYLLSFFVVWAFSDQVPPFMLIYGRQYFIRTLTILPLSPGGVGLAELAFLAFLCEFITRGLSTSAMLVWRLLSYYVYLIAGLIVLPRWLSRAVYSKMAD